MHLSPNMTIALTSSSGQRPSTLEDTSKRPILNPDQRGIMLFS